MTVDFCVSAEHRRGIALFLILRVTHGKDHGNGRNKRVYKTVCCARTKQKNADFFEKHGGFCVAVSECYHLMMDGTSTPEKRGWAFPIKNIVAIVLTVPVTFFLLIAGTFAQDAGPNITGQALVLLTFVMPVLVLASVVLSQVKRSKRWANIGCWIPLLVVIAFIALVFVDDFYLHPRLGPLAQ